MTSYRLGVSLILVAMTNLSFGQDKVSNDTTIETKPAQANEVFQQRIMPIFRSTKPSSCVQCHLASVDLKDYIRPSSEQTFVSLRDQGMIDLENPENSKILELIRMGEDDFDKGARLIHKDLRNSEYKAFSAWIVACCKDQEMIELPQAKDKDLASPDVANEVIRHGRKGRLLNSFVRNIWSQRLRCFPCHTPNDIKSNQIKIRDRFDNFEVEYGDRMTLFKKTPLETMNSWIERSKHPDQDELPLLNFKEPSQSLIVLKPTAKLPPKVNGKIGPPSYNIPVSHMGGLKMHVNDQSYKSFLAWIKDYAALDAGKYQTVDQLPHDNWFATKRILRVKELPEQWKTGTTVQLMVHRWLADQGKWSKNAMAFTQGTITPRRMVNGALFLLAPTDLKQRRNWATAGNKFRPGKYLVKIYVDKSNQIQDAPEILLGSKDWIGDIEIENAKWQIGFPKAETVSGSQIKQ